MISPHRPHTYTLQNESVRFLNSHHDVTHGSTLVLSVGGDDDVDVLHDTLEGLVQLLRLQLQLQKSTVHFVHHQDWLNALADGLSQHGLGLHAHT